MCPSVRDGAKPHPCIRTHAARSKPSEGHEPTDVHPECAPTAHTGESPPSDREEPDTMTNLRTTLIAGFAFQSVLVEALTLVVGGILSHRFCITAAIGDHLLMGGTVPRGRSFMTADRAAVGIPCVHRTGYAPPEARSRKASTARPRTIGEIL
jgi:hypothetical protein